MIDERESFLKAIEAEPLDHHLRCVFADWLDENGEEDEADRQRKFVTSFEYLRQLSTTVYYASFLGDEDERGDSKRIPFDQVKVPFSTLMDEFQYWHRSAEHGELCFGTDNAAEVLHLDSSQQPKFLEALEAVIGKKLAANIKENVFFRCAC